MFFKSAELVDYRDKEKKTKTKTVGQMGRPEKEKQGDSVAVWDWLLPGTDRPKVKCTENAPTSTSKAFHHFTLEVHKQTVDNLNRPTEALFPATGEPKRFCC